MARILPIAVIFLCIVAVHGKPGKYLRKSLEFKRSIETFSMKLLNESLASANDNFIESPISVWNMLTVLAEGANGNTLKQLKSIAHNNVEQSFVKKAFHNVTQALLVNTTTVKLQSVNAVFLPLTTEIDRSYKHSILKNFLTKVFLVDFDQEDPTKRVNRFVEKNTGGNIKNFLTKDVVRDANMILINAIHFKGQWTVPFDPEETIKDSFYDSHNEVIGEANYMHGIGTYNFMIMKKINAQILEIPYGVEGRLSMIVVLPIPANSLRTVIYQISKVGIDNIISRLSESSMDEVEFYIPRFKISSDLGLDNMLRNMGITDMFIEGVADFSINSNKDLFVSAAIHKAMIEVNEEGATASAASGAVMVNRMASDPILFDKPFVYFIVEKTMNMVVFQGVYLKPELY